jgi:hypothetical protein
VLDSLPPVTGTPKSGLLAEFTGLGISNHNVTVNIMCHPGTNANIFHFDYAMVDAWVGPSGSPTSQTIDDMDPVGLMKALA